MRNTTRQLRPNCSFDDCDCAACKRSAARMRKIEHTAEPKIGPDITQLSCKHCDAFITYDVANDEFAHTA